MLTILQFDAASINVLDRMLAAGRLPVVGAPEPGVWHDLEAPATAFAAGAQHTLYSGVPIGEHGLFYPFQWSPTDQRVRYTGDLPAPPPIWERLGPHGTRTLAVDPVREPPPDRRPARHARAVVGSSTTGSCCSDGARRRPKNDRLEGCSGSPSPSTRCSAATPSRRCSLCADASCAHAARIATRPSSTCASTTTT